MKINRCTVSILAFSAFLTVSSTVYSSDSHHHSHDGQAMSTMNDTQHQMAGMFLVKKTIDGYDVNFQVMMAKPGMMMGGSHDFMIKMEKDGKALSNVVMNTKVVHPDGQSETKPAMQMGDWLMAGYDLSHTGEHQMMILFKTEDGKTHKGGVYYPGS